MVFLLKDSFKGRVRVCFYLEYGGGFWSRASLRPQVGISKLSCAHRDYMPHPKTENPKP